MSYGEQIVLTDLGAFLVGGILTATTATAAPLFLSVAVAAPVVHGLHGNPGRAVGSMFLHLGLTAAGVFAGLAIDPCEESHRRLCGSGAAMNGFIVGLVVASTIDALVLAADVPPPPPKHAKQPQTSWAPTVSVQDLRHVAMGVSGVF